MARTKSSIDKISSMARALETEKKKLRVDVRN